MKSSDIVEVINSLPLNKLIDTISAAIGKVYEPRHIKKMADAKAYEISQVASAIKDNTDVPIQYTGQEGALAIDSTDVDDLIKRVGMRLANQEIRKQENIDAIVSKSYQELENESDVSSEPVDVDWTMRFMNYAGEIGNEELQNLWAKILSGEVKQPNTFSLRTLDVVRNLTCKEAELFVKVSPLVVSDFIINDLDFLQKYNLSYSDILLLDNCGLINSNGMISRKFNIQNSRPVLLNKDYIFLAESHDGKECQLNIQVFILTEAGKSVLKVINAEVNKDYFVNLCKNIKKKYSKFDFALYRTLKIQGDSVEYDTQNNLLDDTNVID